MLLLNSTILVDLHLTIKGEYFDHSWDSMIWEAISTLKTGFTLFPNDTREEFFVQYAYPHISTANIYMALIPELHQSGKLPSEYLSYSLDSVYEKRESIQSAIENYYFDLLNESIGKYGDWEGIGHEPSRSLEWCKRHYDKEVIQQYEEFLTSWDNLAKAKAVNVMGEIYSQMMDDLGIDKLDFLKITGLSESEFDSTKTQTENHEESLEVDSDIFVDPSQINEDKLYESIVYLFSKRNQVGEQGEISFLITLTFDNDDYVITLSKSVDSLSRFITIIDSANNIDLVTKRLKTIFDESGDSLIIWDAIKTFNINKSQLKAVYDNEISG